MVDMMFPHWEAATQSKAKPEKPHAAPPVPVPTFAAPVAPKKEIEINQHIASHGVKSHTHDTLCTVRASIFY